MLYTKTALAALALVATTSFAVGYAQNPDVQKRQEAMGIIGANMKSLTQMMKGEKDFSAEAAQAAVDAIAAKAAEVPALFETKASDPESDAADKIWDNFDDFTAKAKALETAAAGITISSMEDIGGAMGAMGGACKACHTDYKL